MNSITGKIDEQGNPFSLVFLFLFPSNISNSIFGSVVFPIHNLLRFERIEKSLDDGGSFFFAFLVLWESEAISSIQYRQQKEREREPIISLLSPPSDRILSAALSFTYISFSSTHKFSSSFRARCFEREPITSKQLLPLSFFGIISSNPFGWMR